jgi:hypothetical protein
MQKTTVGVLGKLTKDGAKDIALLVHSYYVGRLSPCVVIEDGANLGLTGGGHIESLDQVFQIRASKHEGYVIQERMAIDVATPESVETQSV